MSAHSRELPVDRLATTDSAGNRIYLYPADVKGRYRKLRTWVSLFLTLIFLGLPWIRMNGQPAILLDLVNRKFAIFGLTFWAHDAPLLLFVFGGVLLSLAFVTSIWGRIWCGWACPQTVFIDSIFRRIERWIEGDSLARKKLDESPLSFHKISRKGVKWGAFTVIAGVISHSFLAYFVGTETLSAMMRQSPWASAESFASFLLMAAISVGILFDFGWFREQFCTLVCPYGRFQSVLMDDSSKVVHYNSERGEPRRGSAASTSGLAFGPVSGPVSGKEKLGDCVNCYRCVQVCPTGIDIRRGLQLECISCMACIDACDEVMVRLKKPRGLIRYQVPRPQAADVRKSKVSLRPVVLGVLLSLVLAGLVLTIRNRDLVESTWIRAVDSPYQVVQGSQGESEVINHFKVHVRNQSFQKRKIRFQVLSAPQNLESFSLVTSNFPAAVEGGTSARGDVFIRFKKSELTLGKVRIQLQLDAVPVQDGVDSQEDPKTELDLDFKKQNEVTLVGPL